MNYIIVAIFAFFGGISRYLLGLAVIKPDGFPLGTLIINLVGCFILAFLVQYVEVTEKVPEWVTLGMKTGFIGAFTTFSTYSLEAVTLIETQQWWYALIYGLTTIIGGLLLTLVGYSFGNHVGDWRKQGDNL
ncbi:fluoride efflux transporter CrcB [Dellaglioa algida]|uniref:Fluoride-specific ion channel FluC n=1 Tax=Dellaglioa algida TaxID=105612 RepID=A0A5C6MBJ8_9LACO|nr:fluoride efflux transporter CrcB [Dellaglioa algida]MDK1716006.1 fluoride efflux transporter CrcB [Dellaglioa algida]MDK1719287.1 fluoride efflux transporter CrcB [Dellaglioa algida]MDK1721211.1 fluoride efflux transporter CrcB [Dellaglioa algida]MDK1722630.1 fluoride efflux transporter CrcB [Dellaglioa algida]MDK1724249.1 fluoride efflux transporter CrcB [Dellaglioa algida]